METKRCSKCKEVKKLEEFNRQTASKDGRHHYCKQCMRDYMRQRRIDNPDESRQYYAENRERIKRQVAQWHVEHPDYQRQWHADNPEKAREYTAKWRVEHPEYSRQYYDEHREEAKESAAKYRASHRDDRHQYYIDHHEEAREYGREYKKQYYATHQEEIKKYAQEYYTAHREERLEYACQYRIDHPEKSAAQGRRRRAREAGANGDSTARQFIELCNQYDNRCLCCGEVKKLTADHIVPLSKGGSNDIKNLQPLCQSCNSSKGTKTIDYRDIK